MPKTKPPDPKIAALRQHGSLNPHPDKVSDPLFAGADFFDARDLVQVKYEMVRRVRVDGQPVSHSAAAFGFSRPSFYQAQAALDARGAGGSGAAEARAAARRTSSSTEVMDFLQQLRGRCRAAPTRAGAIASGSVSDARSILAASSARSRDRKKNGGEPPCHGERRG